MAEARAEAGQLELAEIDVESDLAGGETRGRGHRSSRPALLLEQRNMVTVEVANTADTPLAGVPVVFYDGDPERGGKAFDVQHIPRLRENASQRLRTFFSPTTCGDHTLFVRVGHLSAPHDLKDLDVDVTIDSAAELDALLARTTSLGLPRKIEARLLGELGAAERALDQGLPKQVRNSLAKFLADVEEQRGPRLSDREAESLIAAARLISQCAI